MAVISQGLNAITRIIMSTSVSFPAPPDGYRYMLDGKGNQTTVLTKIDIATNTTSGSSYVAFSEVSSNVSTASGNLLSATEALSSAMATNTDPTVSGVLKSASDLVTNAWGKLQSLNPLSTTSESKSIMESAKGLLETATAKLDSVGSFVSGQVSGLISSAKQAIGAAKDAIGAGITKITDAAKKLAGDAMSNIKKMLPEDTQGPNFKDTMDSIKSGAVYKDISSSLSKVADVASSLPTDMAAGLATAQAAIAAKMSALQQKIGTEMALAKANQDLLTKETIASTGSPPTQEQLDAAAGNIAIFKDGPKYLADQAKSIATTVASYASAFGTKVGNALGVIKDGAETGAATAVGAKVTEFVNSVPPETIPDPENPTGPAIPNPEYTAFASANADKMSAVTSLTSAVQTASAGFQAGFTSLVSAADSAKASIISSLKASALAGQMSASASGLVADIKNQTLDMSKIDALNMAKTTALSAKAAATDNPNASGNETQAKVDPKVKQMETSEVPKSNANDKVFKVEVYDYHKEYVVATKDFLTEAKKKAEATELYSTNLANKAEANKADADEATKAKYNASKSAFVSSAEFVAYKEALDLYNKEVDNYNNYVYKAWENNLSRSTIPAEIKSRLSMQSAYESVTKKT